MTPYVLAGILIIATAWVLVRMNRGHALGAALVDFEKSYDGAFRARSSKRDALRIALKAFEATPKLRELHKDDVDAIVEIVGTAGDPKRVIRELVVRLNAAAVLEALRNRNFLTELVVATSRTGRARVEESYVRCAQEAFGAAKDFAALREELNAQAGTLASVAKNLSRTVDYDQFSHRAAGLEARVEALAERSAALTSDGSPSGPTREFYQLMRDLIAALSVATGIFADKAAFLAKKARSASAAGTAFSDFTRITQDEEVSLERCQGALDRLARLYPEVAG